MPTAPGLTRLFIALAIAVTASAPARGADAENLAFFESRIRPILVKHCYECHGADPKKVKGGLLLDSRDGLLKGGDSGPAVVPGKPQESLLLKAIRHDDLQMPPSGKLPEAVASDFERWIRQGAIDPRRGAAVKKAKGLSIDEGRKFWSYRPVQNQAIPSVRDASWPRVDLDRFILSRLESEKLQPAKDADRVSFIRRVTFDLTGLPPTPEQIDAYVKDASPEADARLVDRLLADSAYGERWGRHWLDLARYAESLTLRGFVFPGTWRYRDYAIESFNADVPFNWFIREQIAGDLLPGTDLQARRRNLTAVQFLLMGNSNLEEQDKKNLELDIIDEQLDVVSRVFLAQTVTCARCHDHKFDPIPTKDYYALAGILASNKFVEHANVSKWLDTPLPVEPEKEAELKSHEARVASLQDRIKKAKSQSAGKSGAKGSAAKGAIAVADVPGIVIDEPQAKSVGSWKHSTSSGTYIGSGYIHDENSGKGEKTLTFLPELPAAGEYEIWFAYSHGNSRSKAVPITVLSADGDKQVTVDESVPPPLDGRYVSLGTFRFERGNQGSVIVSNEGTMGHVTADAVVFIPANAVPKAAAKPTKPATEAKAAAEPKGATDQLKAMETELARLQEKGPKRELVLGIRDQKPEDLRIHIRGSRASLGEPAPRGVLQVASSGSAVKMPAEQSGRLELADWIASDDNPLTARVIVNRVWHWMFGSGLVRTVDNFGTTGELPSHPELLEHLTRKFMADGWSIRKLVRTIALSRVYRQASDASPQSVAIDPENRLWSHMNRRRLDAESIRDSILACSGQLDRKVSGPSLEKTLASDLGARLPDSKRRSVYLPVLRNSLPPIFEVFDFADPSMPVGARPVSTVAPQSLFLLNHPFVQEQAQAIAERILKETHSDDAARVDGLYRLMLGRAPTEAERATAVKAVEGSKQAEDWAQLTHALLASIEFRYVR